MSKGTCSIDGCDVLAAKKGMCEAHYRAERRAAPKSPCSVEGCETSAQVTGLCLRHYHRKRRWGTTEDREPARSLGPCSTEGCDRTEKSRGLCGMHYARSQREKYGTCTIEDCDKGASSRHGLCAMHYQRKLVHGTTDDPGPRRKMALICSVERCDRETRARHLCVTHYARWKKFGTVDPPPPSATMYCKGCAKHVPRVDYDQNNGRCIPCARDLTRDKKLFRAYRVFKKDVDAQLELQGHRCAICGIHQDDVKRKFAVDHCHQTGRMRAMLCGECNFGLGKFKDDPHILTIAIAYLQVYAPDET